MTFTTTAKDAAKRLSSRTRDWRAARQEMSESDISPDASVAGSRANNDGDEERLIEAARLLETVREGWRGIAGQVAELPADGR